MGKRRCYICKKLKGLENNFYRDRSQSNNFAYRCKKCDNNLYKLNYKVRKRRKNYAKRLYKTPKHKEYRERLARKPERIYGIYSRNAKKRNYAFNISFNEFMIFWQKPCYYCRQKIATIGLDRIDNSKGYEKLNLVSCCKLCNRAKGKLSKGAFIKMCQIIAKVHSF